MTVAVLLRAVHDPELGGGTYEGTHVLDGPSLVALGIARRWRKAGGRSRVVGIAIGPAEWEPALRMALALECDEVRQAAIAAGDSQDAIAEARAIAACIPAGTTLVIGGESAGGVLLPALAEVLGWPFVGGVTGVTPDQGGLALALRAAGGRRGHRWTNASIVVAAARMPAPALYPRLARYLAARKAVIPAVTIDNVTRPPALAFAGYGPARPSTKSLIQPSASANPAQRLRQLMAGGISNRSARTVSTASEDGARQLADLLASNGFIS